MERQRAKINKKYNKIRPKTPLLNKRQNSFKVSKAKNNNKKTIQRDSPKTIDYNKLMEKYGDMIDNSFDKSSRSKISNDIKKNQEGTKTPLNRSPDREFFLKHNLTKTELISNKKINYEEEKNYNSNIKKKNIIGTKLIKNQKQRIQIPFIKYGNNIVNKKNIGLNNNIRKNKNNSIIKNRYNSNSSHNMRNKIDNSEFEKLKDQISYLKEENLKLKANTINNNYSNIDNYIEDKLLLLLELCRKFGKKFKKLYPLFEINNTSESNLEIYEDLKNTIIQYNNMIFSDKITNLFKIKSNFDTISKNENTLNPLDMSEFEPKSISINIIEKYKTLIKELKDENNELKNKFKNYYNKDEYNSMKQKLKEVLNENNNLKNKINELIEKQNKFISQNNTIENLKCQIETLNNSIKYKDNKINYLQNILEKTKINPSIFNSDSILSSIQNNNITPAKVNNKFPINNNTYNYMKDNNIEKDNKKINRYDNNNIISKISISTYDPNLNSNCQNSNFLNNKSSISEISNNLINNNINQKYINQNSKDIIYNLKENLKNEDSGYNNENVNIMTPYKIGNKINEGNFYNNDKYQLNEFNKQENYKTGKNETKKEQIVLNNEIAQLDQEILNLKSKLTKIIKK